MLIFRGGPKLTPALPKRGVTDVPDIYVGNILLANTGKEFLQSLDF